MIVDFDNGTETQSFLLNRGSKWPPVFTYDGSVTFKLLENRLNTVKLKWDKWYCFKLLEAMMYGNRKWLYTSKKSVSGVRYLGKLIQPSYTLYKSHFFYCSRLASSACYVLRCVKAWEVWPRSCKLLNCSQMPKVYCFAYETW